MTGDLTFILNLWEDAIAPRIEVRTPEWPELVQYKKALWTLFRTAGDVELLTDTRKIAFQAYLSLATTPLAPNADVIGLDAVGTRCLQFAEDWPLHSSTKPLLALADAADALRSVPSVFCTELEDVASHFESSVLVSPGKLLKTHVEAVLSDLELNGVEVATRAELHKSGACFELEVIIGDPAATYASIHAPGVDEATRSGWLLTAPQAPRVAVLLAAGCQTLETERCWPLGKGHHSPLHVGDKHGKPINIPPISQHLTTSRTFTVPTLSPVFTSGTTVLAQPVFFASGRWMFFSNETPPEPRVVLTGDDGTIEIRHSHLGKLRPGAIVAVRVGRGESDEIARRAADRLGSEGFTAEMVASALKTSQTLKRLLAQRITEMGIKQVECDLRARGLSAEYARVLARHPLRAEYIAPGSKGYNAFVEMLGEPHLTDKQPLLKRLRHARRMAGRDIRNELETQLCSNTSWTDDLYTVGYAQVETPGLGAMFLEIVTCIFDESQQVAITSLGHLFDPDGSEHTYESLPC